MKIAFDAQPLADSQKTGVGFYTAQMMRFIIRNHPEHEYIFPFFCLRHPEEKLRNLQPYLADNARALPCKWFSGALYKMLWAFIPIPHRLFFHTKAGVSQFFNFNIPPGVSGKKVTVIHDMTYRAFPDTVRLKTKVMLDLNLKASCRRADRIVTVSEFSKREILRYLPVPEEKIEVAPCGVDLSVFRPDYEPERVQGACARHGVKGEYFLYLGTLEPRKNLTRLIEAYALLVRELPGSPLLVMAGRKGWMYDEIFARVKELGLEQRVVFTGYVPDEDAPLLLCGALAFVFPSLYEGFGMPPLEAMACGTPVLTADAASLPEVTGDAALLVDPLSVEEMRAGMRRLATDAALRQTLREKGLARAKLFTWESAAEKLYAVYEKLMGE